jgi:hypothetical protein
VGGPPSRRLSRFEFVYYMSLFWYLLIFFLFLNLLSFLLQLADGSSQCVEESCLLNYITIMTP